MEIAQNYNQPQINPLLTKAAEQLLTLNKLTTAIELYRRAGMHPEAARLLQQLGQEQAATKAHPLRAKQLFVLAAAEVEMFRVKSFAVEHNTTATQLGTMAVGTMATMSTMAGGRAGALLDCGAKAGRDDGGGAAARSRPAQSSQTGWLALVLASA